MKLTVLTWLRDASLNLIGRSIELLFRLLLLILPMGMFLLLIQTRNKASKVSSISVYTNDDSVWQHIFPGFLLVAIDPNVAKNSYLSIKSKIQTWVKTNKYILTLIFMALLVILMIIKG